MLRSDTVTMLTSHRRVASAAFQQCLRHAADREDSQDRAGGTPDDQPAAAVGGRGLGGQETFDPGRVQKRHTGKVDEHLARPLFKDLGQEIAQDIRSREVDLALALLGGWVRSGTWRRRGASASAQAGGGTETETHRTAPRASGRRAVPSLCGASRGVVRGMIAAHAPNEGLAYRYLANLFGSRRKRPAPSS